METQPNELSAPMELLDLEHANSITLSITSFELGVTKIHPKVITPRDVRIFMEQQNLTAIPPPGTPIFKLIPVLRVFGTRLDKASPAHYWDISSLTLQADLLPRLEINRGGTLTVILTANGQRPTKRYSVEVV